MPLRCCCGAMRRPTRCGWTAAEPAPATSGTATCASRGTVVNGSTGLPRAVATPASHRTTASAGPAGSPWPPAAWSRRSTEPAAAGWSTTARTAHAGHMGAKVSRMLLHVLRALKTLPARTPRTRSLRRAATTATTNACSAQPPAAGPSPASSAGQPSCAALPELAGQLLGKQLDGALRSGPLAQAAAECDVDAAGEWGEFHTSEPSRGRWAGLCTCRVRFACRRTAHGCGVLTSGPARAACPPRSGPARRALPGRATACGAGPAHPPRRLRLCTTASDGSR
jgi:hypothetical protein